MIILAALTLSAATIDGAVEIGTFNAGGGIYAISGTERVIDQRNRIGWFSWDQVHSNGTPMVVSALYEVNCQSFRQTVHQMSMVPAEGGPTPPDEFREFQDHASPATMTWAMKHHLCKDWKPEKRRRSPTLGGLLGELID